MTSLAPMAPYFAGRVGDVQRGRLSCATSPYLRIGDSLSASITASSVGGRVALNAGMSGARVSTVRQFLLPSLANLQVSGAIILLGANNAGLGMEPQSSPEYPEFLNYFSDFSLLIADILPIVPTLLLCTLTPWERKVWEPSIGAPTDTVCAIVRSFNTAIRFVASAHGLPCLDLHSYFVGPDGTAKLGSTIDGLHWSSQAHETVRLAMDAAVTRMQTDFSGWVMVDEP